MEIFGPYIAVLLGLAFLVWSSDKFVDAAVDTANILKVSPFIIGMVVVGFGTSAPELLVSVNAALEGNAGIAIGNAFGSNIANLSLILGASALLQTLHINRSAVKRDLPLLLAITLITLVLIFDLYLSRINAILLLILLIGIMVWQTLNAKSDKVILEEFEIQPTQTSLGYSMFWLFFSLVVLVLATKALVWGSVEIARSFGVSDLVIGLTLVAVGTSLPELAASLAAALKGNADLAVGNVIGSNLFNTLGVLGIAGALSPIKLESAVLYRDLPLTLILTFAVFLFGIQKTQAIRKWQGAILLLVFIGFQTSLFLTA